MKNIGLGIHSASGIIQFFVKNNYTIIFSKYEKNRIPYTFLNNQAL